MREPNTDETVRGARQSGRRTPTRVLLGLSISGVVAIVIAAAHLARRPDGERRLGPGAVVTRGAARVAVIEREAPGRGRGRAPLYFALARGPVIDSARIGVLAARLVPGTEGGADPVVALVPRDSVAGLEVVARLVVTPGEPGLLVFGRRGTRP